MNKPNFHDHRFLTLGEILASWIAGAGLVLTVLALGGLVI